MNGERGQWAAALAILERVISLVAENKKQFELSLFTRAQKCTFVLKKLFRKQNTAKRLGVLQASRTSRSVSSPSCIAMKKAQVDLAIIVSRKVEGASPKLVCMGRTRKTFKSEKTEDGGGLGIQEARTLGEDLAWKVVPTAKRDRALSIVFTCAGC